jgi:hypothetical protein
VGLGARALVGQQRWIDGFRVVARWAPPTGGRTSVEVSAGASPTPSAALSASDGAVADRWADRATLGAGIAWSPAAVGPAALRLVAGPEVRWTEHWLYYDRKRVSASGWPRVAGIGGAGAAVRIGRWEVVVTGFGRASSGEGPVLDGGGEIELRYALRP